MNPSFRARRSELMIRWLGLSQSESSDEPGLLLIQIDGLSRPQLESAIRRHRMPFLQGYIDQGSHRLHTMYSGLPSTTPAVQGELFYGVSCAVPAFGFRDPASGCMVRMLDCEPAAATEESMSAQNLGLLAEGSAYTNIYTGGAAEPHFCAATMGWNGMFDKATVWNWIGIVLLNWFSIFRAFILMLVEFGVGLVDVVKGLWSGQKLAVELNLIPSRVAVGVGLRELATIGASMDLIRGLPVVQLNFLGYDEQAHRRGPGSRFAHWSLQGIDDAIKRLVEAAQSSKRRKYEVWIYSDHGQENAVPYESRHGRTIQEAIDVVMGAARGEPENNRPHPKSKRFSRRQWISNSKGRVSQDCESPGIKGAVEVIAMGPIGHVYFAAAMDANALGRLARQFVEVAQVPMVLRCDSSGSATAWTAEGKFALPAQAGQVVGANHPFLNAIAGDLTRLCHHQAAGDLVLCGWKGIGNENITFADENGSHGGPGTGETHAFALLPKSACLSVAECDYFRPSDLRRAAHTQFDRKTKRDANSSTLGEPSASSPTDAALNLHPTAEACEGS